MEDNILTKAIQAVQNADIAFSKYITANDTGATGGHQSGYHLHKTSWPLAFDRPGERGSNNEKFITINWQDDFETQSRFIYYGKGTRDEYRLTRFGKNFPYLEDENIGDLLVLIKRSENFYEAFVLSADEDIDEFLITFNISTTDVNGLILKQSQQTAEDNLIRCFMAFTESLQTEFPSTADLSSNARNCYNRVKNITPRIIKANPDREILAWLNTEFQLFKAIENKRYSDRIKTPFSTVEELIEIANTILNRRKSRAGKSLEHHLAEVFNTFELDFVTQAVTEGNKKPDFLFPNAATYNDPRTDPNKLIVLASKTTCKDRWRQVLNEADKIQTKHLFTLQQGISRNQLEEMYEYDVCLVVPKPYLTSFPEQFRSKILTLDTFVQKVQTIQNEGNR